MSLAAHAQSREIYHRNDLTLIFLSNDPAFNVSTRQRMVETFFQVYPAMMNRFNPDAQKQIAFCIDTAYHGVAEVNVETAYVHFDPEWLRQHPEDIDVVTHEVMHLAQNYPLNAGPEWLVEGIADYSRYKFGVNNVRAGWRPTPYETGQRYRDSYRVTANFLLWIEAHSHVEIVYFINRVLHDGLYTDALWETLTGKKLDVWWKLYAEDSLPCHSD